MVTLKKTIQIVLVAFLFINAHAQLLDPVKWQTKIEKKSESTYVLTFEGLIEKEWHVYSQFTPEGGPLPTELLFHNAKNNYEIIGDAKESETKRVFNELFNVDEIFFVDKITLQQEIKQTHNDVHKIQVELFYQVCKESCVNQSKYFEFDLQSLKSRAIENFEDDKTVSLSETNPVKTEPGTSNKEGISLWHIFLGTLIAGWLVTFTPCVFPMIPMTVSFFLKQTTNTSKGKFNALFYGFCIVAIYVLISLPFHVFESISPDVFNEISTNVYVNLFFFVIFVIFALSFLGAFEITIPSKFVNKADNASNISGLIGIFFMALTLIIVSFSCTGPALGLILGSVLATEGGATSLTIAMLGFGLGLAMPFMLFALFPKLLGNLPKSGGWLNTIKVFFGFIELALAFKFLSNADLVLQLHLLEREVFLAIWIALFGMLALYLFGKISLPHDTPITNISIGRLSIGLVVLAFTIYLIPGLWGAPLKMISGFPPPLTYSESPYGVGNSKKSSDNSTRSQLPEGAHKGPHDIVAFLDYEEGLAYAKSINKPILLDFTGYACVNCRKMEDYVWSDDQILSILKNDYVLISLYVDDKRVLPTSKQYISKETGKKIETIGNKWSDFQIARYKANVQPFYVLLDTNGNDISQPIGYTPNSKEYLIWLKNDTKK